MGLNKWWQTEVLGKEMPKTVGENAASGMQEGIAQGKELLADKDLAKSRAGLKSALSRTSSSQDEINQKASRAVANQRYQGNTQSSALQKKEMTRAVSSDLSKDAYRQDMAKAAGAYNLDLNEMKFAGGMGTAQAAMAASQTERKQSFMESTLDTLGMGLI